jgi:hypothetical protein
MNDKFASLVSAIKNHKVGLISDPERRTEVRIRERAWDMPLWDLTHPGVEEKLNDILTPLPASTIGEFRVAAPHEFVAVHRGIERQGPIELWLVHFGNCCGLFIPDPAGSGQWSTAQPGSNAELDEELRSHGFRSRIMVGYLLARDIPTEYVMASAGSAHAKVSAAQVRNGKPALSQVRVVHLDALKRIPIPVDGGTAGIGAGSGSPKAPHDVSGHWRTNHRTGEKSIWVRDYTVKGGSAAAPSYRVVP